MRRMMLVVLAFAFMLGHPVSAKADEIGARVAVLNLQKLMRDSKASQSIRNQIESRREQYQKDISADEERLRQRDQELTEQRALLSAEAFEEQRQQFKQEVTDVQRDVQQMRASLDKAYGSSLAEVQEAITDIIAELSSEKGFAVALPAGQTLYFSQTLDITDDVLTRLDSRLPEVEVKVEQ